uniref:TGF_BETA_2 domain-containing protein n=1 Tax=Angiostrongylus costaricensis TaxID=334426 RepID=A0A0R3PCK7_ANGCS
LNCFSDIGVRDVFPGKDPYYLSNIQLESFIIASFLDEQIHIPQRTARTRRSVEPIPEINVTERKLSFNELIIVNESYQEWVIAPEGYSTNYCSGACSSDSPMHSKMNATNHAIVQTLVHLVDPKRAEEAKCAPIQLSPAKILFIDNHGNVVMRRYQDMTVQECGCL